MYIYGILPAGTRIYLENRSSLDPIHIFCHSEHACTTLPPFTSLCTYSAVLRTHIGENGESQACAATPCLLRPWQEQGQEGKGTPIHKIDGATTSETCTCQKWWHILWICHKSTKWEYSYNLPSGAPTGKLNTYSQDPLRITADRSRALCYKLMVMGPLPTKSKQPLYWDFKGVLHVQQTLIVTRVPSQSVQAINCNMWGNLAIIAVPPWGKWSITPCPWKSIGWLHNAGQKSSSTAREAICNNKSSTMAKRWGS